MPSRLLAAGLLALVAATWKLWTPQDVFPQVPLIRAACDWPGWFDWVCLTVLVMSSLTLLVVGQRGWWSRGSCIGMAVSLAGFFVLDQHRLQPWAWQFFLLAVLLSLADDITARRGWRWLVVGIYFWSAVSKLDYTFCHEQGPALLGGLKQAMGLRGMPNRWTEALDIAGSFGIALGELGVAVLLAWPCARWLGLWTATIMHLSLLAALGPLGLNHSLGVLLWNVFFIAQDWLLFSETLPRPTSPDETASPRVVDRLWNWLAWPAERNNRLALGGLIAMLLWPSLEPFGYCDHWLAWAVYSSRTENAVLIFNKVAGTKPLPESASVTPDNSPRQAMELNRWSLNALGVPGYPQNRFYQGVALAILDQDDIAASDFLIASLPNRWTGQGHTTVWKYAEAELRAHLVRMLENHFVNGRPRRSTSPTQPKDPEP